jgi:ribulose-5-phosphate 4-epimerase/fuculose-1-phosphate aldolase
MTKASSESLSHAAIYEAEPVADAVIHVHHHELWESFRGELPTTAESAEYGTPEMAFSLQELAVRATDTEGRVIVMGGHEDGVVAFGRTLDEAGNSILALLERIGER